MVLALRVFSPAGGIFRSLLPPLKPSSPQSLRIWPDVTSQQLPSPIYALDSMVASFGVKFPRGMVWYRISIGIGIRIGIDGGSVVVCCMVLQE